MKDHIMTTKEELKAAELKLVGGLTGEARREAKKAFYEANKAAIKAATNADADEKLKALKAPETALIAAAAAKGLEAFFTADIGYSLRKGSSFSNMVIAVFGNTYNCKDVLKSCGATWNGTKKCWVFATAADFEQALAAI